MQKLRPSKTALPTGISLNAPGNEIPSGHIFPGYFAGFLGLHRFYVGRAGSGVLWFVSLGLLSVGWIYDLVMIATGEFVDDQGKRVLYWE